MFINLISLFKVLYSDFVRDILALFVVLIWRVMHVN
ncbi:hypothetical protein BVI2075_780041 [Burkholderia vietnamiensis]|nr:hypothetical protein BVI2075_780041 [Burkholderia vietnamiensis]